MERSGMRVYLVPLGDGRHEPYCEVDDGDHDAQRRDPAMGERGALAGLKERFRAVVTAAERHRPGAQLPGGERRGVARRLRDAVMRWIAEKVAEQRLLWHLRRERAACLVYPSDLAPAGAMVALRAQLQRDGERHWRWLFVDGALLVGSGVLAIVPGPNLLAYYFAFRVVGHFLSWRGARHGLRGVAWSTEASDALLELRRLAGLDRAARHARVLEVARALGLEHLATFYERVTPKRA